MGSVRAVNGGLDDPPVGEVFPTGGLSSTISCQYLL